MVTLPSGKPDLSTDPDTSPDVVTIEYRGSGAPIMSTRSPSQHHQGIGGPGSGGPPRLVAGGTALLLALSMQGLGVGPATAAGPVSAGLTITPTDLNFILKQIQIAEAHATYEGATPGTVRPPNSVLSTTGSDGSANAPHVVNFTLPHGLRTVDGRGNNLTVLTDADQQRVPTSPALAKDLGAADRVFPRMVPLADITWKDTEDGRRWCRHDLRDAGEDCAGLHARGSSATSSPTSRTATLQPWRQRASHPARPRPAPRPRRTSSPTRCPTTSWPRRPARCSRCSASSSTMAWTSSASPAPRRSSSRCSPMIRCTTQLRAHPTSSSPTGRSSIRRSTPSTRRRRGSTRTRPTPRPPPSRCSCVSTSLDGAGKPQSNGRLLDGVGGNIGNWAEVKAQAADLLGIQLVDTDITAVPLLLTDEYGRFLRGANGFPQTGQDRTARSSRETRRRRSRLPASVTDRALVPG